MTLTLVADSLDELPEGLRAGAKEEGGKFRVGSLPQGYAVENITGLKNALAEEKAARRAAAEAAGHWSDMAGNDPVEVKRAFEQFKAGTLKSSKDLEDYRRSVDEKSGALVKTSSEKLAKREAQLAKVLIDQTWAQELAAAGFGRSMKLLMPMCRAQSSIEDVNGELRLVLKDETGKPLISRRPDNHEGMTAAEFVAALRDQPDYRALCDAKPTGGTGGSSQTGGTGRVGIPGQPLSARELLARAHADAK